jgi:hypothetical protein
MWIILGVLVATLILAVVGHLLWIFYRFIFRALIRLVGRARGQKDVDLIALDRRFFAYLFSVEGLRYWAYLGGIIVAVALILLLKDYIAGLLAIRYVQLAGIMFVTALTYIGGWKLCNAPRQRILGTSLMIIGGILLPVNFWYYQEYILMVNRHQAYLVGFICTAVYLFTAIQRSSVLFAYIAPLTFHTSTLLILYKLDYELEIYVFLSALLAILYPLAADYLAERWRKQFKSPLILAAIGGLLFAAIAFLYLKHLENLYLPVYLFIAATLILNKIAQIKLDPRYLFIGIPIVVIIYLRHLESFDLAHYWFGLLFSALALVAIGIWRMFVKSLPNSPYTFYFQLLPLTLIIFSLPVDITSYLYLADKLGSLQQFRWLFTSGSLSIDALGNTWQGVQIGIYYLGYFSIVSLVVFISTGLTFITASIIAVINRSKLVGFYGITALFFCFSIGLIKFWHPMLYIDRYFLFYGGLTLFFTGYLYVPHTSSFAKDAQARRLRYTEPFAPALYIYRTISVLLTYIFAGIYFELSVDHNFDYYLCTLSLLGLVLLYHLKDFRGDLFLKNLKFAAVMMIIGPLLLSSFVHWTSYTFFMLLTFVVGVIFLVFGWYKEDKIYLTLASLTILTEVIYAFLTVEAGQLFIKFLLLLLGLVLILVGVYFRKQQTLKILFLCLMLTVSVGFGIYPVEAGDKVKDDPQVQYLVSLIRASPNDQLIRARLAQYIKKTFKHPDPNSLPDLPPMAVPDRFQRNFLRDDLAAISGIRAIEGTLQLDAMRQQVIRNEKPTIDISSVTPLTITSHDYSEMLRKHRETRPEQSRREGNIPDILEVERILPADKMYLHFPDVTSFFQFVAVFDNYVVPMLNMLTTSLKMDSIGSLLEREFLSRSAPLRDILQTSHLQGMTIVIGDPSIHLGSDITLILETENDTAARALEPKFIDNEQKTPNEKPVALSPFALRPSPFTKTYRRFVIISNNKKALSQIGDVEHSLADASDFLYIQSLHIPGKNGFLYLSEDFVEKLISPEFRIKNLRRYNCQLNLLTLQNATRLYLADGHPVESVTIDNLINQNYLESIPVDLDELPENQGARRYRFDPATEEWSHGIYGQSGHFTSLNDLSVSKIRQVEKNLYDQFRLRYQNYFTRYIDPVGIGFSFDQNRVTLHTVVLPLITDPLYNSTIEYLGREDEEDKPSQIANRIPSNYGISLLLRSRFLKDMLLKRHWIWDRYTYFYRDMQPFLGKNTIFGSELFLGIGDFGFGKRYSSPQKPYPTTLKEFVRLPFEFPVVMLQSLADEKLGQDYLRHLFHLAHSTTIQNTPVYSFNLLGHINLYGSVKNNLLAITLSLPQQKEILEQRAGNNESISEFYHLTAILQTEYLRQFKPHLFRMIQEQLQISCQSSLATLQNLLDLYIARYGHVPEDGNIQKIIEFGKLSKPPFCPQNGTYSINGKKVICSVHGSLDKYHEPDRLTDDFFLNPFFNSLNRLIAQLKFTEEGIVSKVQVELGKNRTFFP